MRYTAVARALHWIIAALVLLNLLLGFARKALPEGLPVMPIHKSIGITILALTLGRILWRLTHKAPPLPASMPDWEKGVAKTVHFLFYCFLVVMPLSGWIMSSAGKRPIDWFFLFDVPKFGVAKGDAIVEVSHEAHELLPWLWSALILLHVAAALHHHVVRRDGVLRRMLG